MEKVIDKMDGIKMCALVIFLTLFACEKPIEVEKVVDDNESVAENVENSKLKAASVTNRGTALYSKYGVNLNNSYNQADKTDWKKFWTYNADLNTALNYLESNITNFKIYRIGFSRAMANDDADLSQWADALKVIKDYGNKMIICLWGEHNFYDASRDAACWQKVVNKITSKGLLNAVKGWELANEPTQGNDLAKYYVDVYRGVNDWKGKKIILDGGAYAKAVSKNLYDGTSSIQNRLWAVHCYPKFVGGGNPDPSLSAAQWRDKFIKAYNDRYKYIDGNFIVTEMGINNDYVSNPSTAKQKRERGFIAANELYFGGNTTVFWYSGYNSGKIGLISTSNGTVRENNKSGLLRVFY